MNPIKLYVGAHYKEPKLYTYSELLFPFWGVTAKETMPYVRVAALQYQYSKNDFALVDNIEDADYVLMPYPYDRFRAANQTKVDMIIREAKRAKKPLIIDGSGDIEHPIDIPNSVILRVSQYRYSKQSNEITRPYLAEDLLETYAGGMLLLREKREKPSVGFTGWASVSAMMRAKIWLKEIGITIAELMDKKRGAEHKGVLFRARALDVLRHDSRIELRSIARASYSGHVATIQGSAEENRRAFVQNMLDSDYALCVKGDGNVSVRFYEALSLGRIPLFLDTACVLPLEDKINYRDFCVFVDWRDLDHMGDILTDFHEKISPEQFQDMQKKARDAYQNYLRRDVFSPYLAAALRQRLTA